MNKTHHDANLLKGLLFLSKLFFVFSFLFYQNFQSQIYVAEGALIHLVNGVAISQSDSVSIKEQNKYKAKIYISAGVQFSNLDSESNFEIVEIVPLKNKKLESKKQLVLNSAKPKLEREIVQKRAFKKEDSTFYNYVFSSSEFEINSFLVGVFSKITIPVSQFNSKQIINSECYKTSIVFGWTEKISVYFKNTELLTAQNKSAFSVRPPPFLA